MKHCLSALLLTLTTGAAMAQATTYAARLLTPETALKATLAALEDCRKRGHQVAAAVVDRSGVAQTMLRDRFAGPHTIATAINKGYTAVSFRVDTLELAKQTQSGMPASGVREIPNVVAVGGGVLIQAGGTTLGALGISGAPTGEIDEACAKAGIAAIRDDIEL